MQQVKECIGLFLESNAICHPWHPIMPWNNNIEICIDTRNLCTIVLLNIIYDIRYDNLPYTIMYIYVRINLFYLDNVYDINACLHIYIALS